MEIFNNNKQDLIKKIKSLEILYKIIKITKIINGLNNQDLIKIKSQIKYSHNKANNNGTKYKKKINKKAKLNFLLKNKIIQFKI